MSSTVYNISHIHPDVLQDMQVIMCKGIGYVVVSKECDPQLIHRMGYIISETIEHDMLVTRQEFPIAPENYRKPLWQRIKNLIIYMRGFNGQCMG
jgi:hypothetical protein